MCGHVLLCIMKVYRYKVSKTGFSVVEVWQKSLWGERNLSASMPEHVSMIPRYTIRSASFQEDTLLARLLLSLCQRHVFESQILNISMCTVYTILIFWEAFLKYMYEYVFCRPIIHRERRKFLRTALKELATVFTDQPGLLGPKVMCVKASLI